MNPPGDSSVGDVVDPVTTEVVRGWMETVTEEMQATVVKTAHSPLICEARDATCALFDRDGLTASQASRCRSISASSRSSGGVSPKNIRRATRSRATSTSPTTLTPAAHTCRTSPCARPYSATTNSWDTSPAWRTTGISADSSHRVSASGPGTSMPKGSGCR